MNLPDGFYELCVLVIEGQASAEQLARFRRLMAADPACRAAYAQQVDLDMLLTCQYGRPALAPCARRVSVWTWARAAAGVAVVGGLLFGAARTMWPEDAALPVIELVRQTAAEGLLWPRQYPGVASLQSGEAVLRLDSGVVLTLVGPAVAVLETRDGVLLKQGRLLADVPEAARGFALGTADLKLADPQGRFGVSAMAGGSDLFVFAGTASAADATGRTMAVCRTGEGARMTRTRPPQVLAASEVSRQVADSFMAGQEAELAELFVSVGRLLDAGSRPLPVEAGTGVFSWNSGDDVWDGLRPGWSGAGVVWASGGDAVFANRTAYTRVTFGVPLVAGSVMIGNGGNNANLGLIGGSGVSLSADTFSVQGDPENSFDTTGYPTVRIEDAAVSVAGDLGVGRAGLVIGGKSHVIARRVGGRIGQVASADWGRLALADEALLEVAEGVSGDTLAWGVELLGGTLVTPRITAGDWVYKSNHAILLFDGTLVRASASGPFVGNDQAFVGAGGARFDTGGHDISVGARLQNAVGCDGRLEKSGEGSLTLTGANTYSGGTTVLGGRLVAGKRWGVETDGTSALGLVVSNNIVRIGDGAVLTGASGSDNWLSNVNSPVAQALGVVVSVGGRLAGVPGFTTGLGAIRLEGGTIEVSCGADWRAFGHPWHGAFVLLGDVEVGGARPSRIVTVAGADGTANVQLGGEGSHPGGRRVFTVADVTADSAADLVVSARLADGTAVKRGTGTLALAAGSTGTGPAVDWTVAAGTLGVEPGSAQPFGGAVTLTSGAVLDIGESRVAAGSLAGAGMLVVRPGGLLMLSGDLTADLAIRVIDPASLDPRQRYRIMTAATPPSGRLIPDHLPYPWKVVVDGSDVLLRSGPGTLVIAY